MRAISGELSDTSIAKRNIARTSGCVTLRKCETPKLRERFGQGLSVVGQWNVLHRVSARDDALQQDVLLVVKKHIQLAFRNLCPPRNFQRASAGIARLMKRVESGLQDTLPRRI
jgi:hypothetical protein